MPQSEFPFAAEPKTSASPDELSKKTCAFNIPFETQLWYWEYKRCIAMGMLSSDAALVANESANRLAD